MSWGKLRQIILNKTIKEKIHVPSIDRGTAIKSLSAALLGKNLPTNDIKNGLKSKSIQIAIHYVLRLIILIACFIGCFAQIGTIMNIFFSYPAIVFVDLKQMEKLLLPGITICNDNRVMRTKLNAYNAEFANKWNALVNRSTDNSNAALKLYQQQLIDNLIRTMLTNLTISEFMTYGNTADDFLDVNFFSCASDKNNPTQKCIFLSNLFTTAQENGNCFTLFHKSRTRVLEDIAINSGLSESAVVRGSVNESVNVEMSIKSFSPNEIIRFRVNFHVEEYTTLNEPISGRFIIHDNKHLAVIRQKSYRIEPGKFYIFYISKLTDELLPAPYVTNCRDYDRSMNKLNNTQSETSNANETVNILFSAPSSKANCIIGCIAKQTIKTCNCWPPELPFLYTGNKNASENSLKWCDWRERPPITNWKDKPNHVTFFQYCFNTHEEECNRECKADCKIDRYTILKEEIEWPSKERIDHSDERNKLRQLRSCCAVISIRYWSAEQTINRYRPRFETAEFTSYIGGLLSMWLGFSLFGFYGLSEKTILNLVNYIIQRRHSKQEAVGGKNRTENSSKSIPNQMLSHQNSQASLLIKSNKIQDSNEKHPGTALMRHASNWTTMYSRRLRNHSNTSNENEKQTMRQAYPKDVLINLNDISRVEDDSSPSVNGEAKSENVKLGRRMSRKRHSRPV